MKPQLSDRELAKQRFLDVFGINTDEIEIGNTLLDFDVNTLGFAFYKLNYLWRRLIESIFMGITKIFCKHYCEKVCKHPNKIESFRCYQDRVIFYNCPNCEKEIMEDF